MSWIDDYDKAGGWKGHKDNPDNAATDSSPGKPWAGKSKASNWKRCWEENHKPLEIGGGTVLGAACGHPAKGFDIYIGFDHGMKFTKNAFPWQHTDSGPVEFLFAITDMCAPKDVKNFKAMIDWLQVELAKGKKVHMGCIGGHGRTGLVLAALIAQVNGEKDAIQWVRKHHCKKGVESTSQVKFLMKYYGTSKAEPTKGTSQASTTAAHGGKGWPNTTTSKGSNGNAQINSVKSKGSIW